MNNCIMGVSGRAVQKELIIEPTAKVELMVEFLKDGIYFIKVVSGGSAYVRKFIVMH